MYLTCIHKACLLGGLLVGWLVGWLAGWLVGWPIWPGSHGAHGAHISGKKIDFVLKFYLKILSMA